MVYKSVSKFNHFIYKFSREINSCWKIETKRKIQITLGTIALKCKYLAMLHMSSFLSWEFLVWNTMNKKNAWIMFCQSRAKCTAESDNAILIRYARNGRIESARQVFDEMPERTVSSWNAMITAYAQNGKLNEACYLFDIMPKRNVVSWNGMISGYVRNGRTEDARRLFDLMPERNAISWTSMVTAYVRDQRIDDACDMFDRMPERNVVSWTAMMEGYIQVGRIDDARQFFDRMPARDVVSWTSMINGYCRCGRMEEAHQLFEIMPVRNVVSWTVMVTGYAHNGNMEAAKGLFDKMPEKNEVSWTAMVTGYAQNGRIKDACQLFEGLQHKSLIAYNAMITGYAQNGMVDEARRLFDGLLERDVVSWTAMLTGYAQSGRMEEALQLFEYMPEKITECWTALIKGYTQQLSYNEAIKLFNQMRQAGIMPNQSTLVSVLIAYASLAALQQGKQVHERIIKMGFEPDCHVGSALITMYVKCGNIANAEHVFRRSPKRDSALWNAMISGFAQHGHCSDALQMFEKMQQAGVKPDHITFVGVLSACSHTGLVDEGWQYFDSMSRDHDIKPTAKHYACMVDLLGRSGRLDKAEDLINSMPLEPDAAVWGALLSACRTHINVEIAERAAEKLFWLEPCNTGPYILLSNIYAAAGRWTDVAKMRQMMKDRRLTKAPGSSWIEVNNKVHAFLGGDRSVRDKEDICNAGEFGR